jgi:hypothetical protein
MEVAVIDRSLVVIPWLKLAINFFCLPSLNLQLYFGIRFSHRKSSVI